MDNRQNRISGPTLIISLPIFPLNDMRSIAGGEHACEIKQSHIRLLVVVQRKLKAWQLEKKEHTLVHCSIFEGKEITFPSTFH